MRSRRARLRFTDRDQNALKWSCRSIDFQRTANSVLTVCVSQGDNPISALSAYHEFEESKLQTALANPAYNPLSKANQNDVIDSEQLVYLGDESLRIITADKGIGRKVKKSKQAERIIIASPGDLMDACKAEAVLRGSLSA